MKRQKPIKRVFPVPVLVAAARDELVRDFVDMTTERRLELLLVLEQYAVSRRRPGLRTHGRHLTMARARMAT